MTCDEFLQIWNALLDARAPMTPAERSRLDAHAVGCADCRGLAAGLSSLQNAMAQVQPIKPPSGFAERVLERWAEEPRTVTFPGLRPARLAAAAALVAAACGLFAWRPWAAQQIAPAAVPVAVQPGDAAEPVSVALATATSATLDLARETSGPAARIGRQVLDEAARSTSVGELPMRLPVRPPSDVLRGVGDDLDRGVRPLTGSARSAFAFLALPGAGAARRDPERRP